MHDGRAWLRLSVGLLLTPTVVALAVAILPGVHSGVALADFISFAGAAGIGLAGLALAVPAKVSMRVALCIALGAVSALGALAYFQPSGNLMLVAADTALVCLAWAIGGSLGRGVQHPSHLFPACVVAASADVVSLLSPEGPSHVVASSERALSVLAVWFPVPGTSAVAPALGIGDLLFIAFVMGVASAHQLGLARAVGCTALGVAAAGLASGGLGVAFPALVPIAAATIVGMPSIRRLRPEDRRAAHWSMLLAASLAVVTVARTAAGRLDGSQGADAAAAWRCPGDMALVEGNYCPKVEQNCRRWLDDPQLPFARCAVYAQPSRCLANRTAARFCIDRYEYTAPNARLPSNFASFAKASALCAKLSKRVCSEEEWNFACEGEAMQPYPYGFERQPVCNQDRLDLYEDSQHRSRLRDLREPATSRPACVSPFGVFNMTGNLDESVRRHGGTGTFNNALKGGWWMPSQNRCRGATTAHDDYYQGIQIGIRCCSEARAAP